jgi:hypothetical protein
MTLEIRSAIVGIVGSFAIGCSAIADKDLFQSNVDTERTWTSLERATLTLGRVGWSSASPAFKRFLLIRDGDFLCAIRFVNYLRGQDASAGSVFSSGDETLTSAYEWYVLEKDGDRFRPAKQGKDTVKRTPLTGIGRLVLAGGSGNVKCGERKFGWEYPAGINFSQVPKTEMKLAPTRWEDIKDIGLDDPKLKWYSFDPKREQVRIPIGEL